MDAPSPRPRHLAHRARVQPARRRLARRFRSAAIALIVLAGCGEKNTPAPVAVPAAKPPPVSPRVEEFRARFVEQRWDDVGAWKAEHVVAGLQAYVDGDDPIYPGNDRRLRRLHGFLYLEEPDPRGFLPLFAPHDCKTLDDPRLLKRDIIALAVVTSFIRRLYENPKDKDRGKLFDVVAAAGVHFSFDPLYGESHTLTGPEIGDFFGDAMFPTSAEATTSLGKELPRYLERWRRRVTDINSSAFFGVVLRHLGQPGAEMLFSEWKRMGEDERYDLLKRVADQETVGPQARRRMVEACLDPSLDVREAAFEALEAQEAPVGELDPSARDEQIRELLEPLRRWARKTKS